jgi:hypothetical protein
VLGRLRGRVAAARVHKALRAAREATA